MALLCVVFVVMQTYLSVLVLFCFLALHLAVRPYSHRILNWFETLSLVVTLSLPLGALVVRAAVLFRLPALH